MWLNHLLCYSPRLRKWKFETESVKLKLWKWKCESVTQPLVMLLSSAEKVKVWKRNCESESVKVWLNRLLCYSLLSSAEFIQTRLSRPLALEVTMRQCYNVTMLQCNNVTIIQYSNHCASTEIQLTLILGCSNIMSAEARRLKFQNLGGKLILSQWRETSSKV